MLNRFGGVEGSKKNTGSAFTEYKYRSRLHETPIMDKFRLDPEKTPLAMVEMLMQILAQQHMMRDILLAEISKRGGRCRGKCGCGCFV
jgi:hypothetical protein